MNTPGRRPDSAHDTRLFSRLAEHTDLLQRNGNRFSVREYIEIPYNEFGIVDKQELFRRVLGSVSADFYWGGSYEGPHHLMWPRESYKNVDSGHDKTLPMMFRGCASLRIIIPRDLHDWTHELTPPPVMPWMEVMRQYLHEQRQLDKLYNIVRFHGLHHIQDMSHENKENHRLHRLHDALDKMEDGQVGLMPDRELLASMPLTQARQAIRSLARVQGLSNHVACQSAFFAQPMSRAA